MPDSPDRFRIPSLRDLDISGCVALTERGFASIARGLASLTALKLGGCSRVATVTDGCVRALAASEALRVTVPPVTFSTPKARRPMSIWPLVTVRFPPLMLTELFP